MKRIVVDAKADTPTGPMDWCETITTDRIATAVMISESNLRLHTNSMHAHFTAVRAMDEALLTEGTSQ